MPITLMSRGSAPSTVTQVTEAAQTTRLVNQPGHGFTGIHPLTYSGGTYAKASTTLVGGVPTMLDNWLCIGVQDEDNFLLATCLCMYDVPDHGLGPDNTRLYVGSDGDLTAVTPAAGQTPLIKLGIATILDAHTLLYFPAVRPI